MVSKTVSSVTYATLSVILFLLYIYGLHAYFAEHWAAFESMLSPMLLQMTFFTSFQVCTISINLLLFSLIYYLKWPFFERMKIDKREWPWEENPTLWKKQRKRLAYGLIRNIFVVLPLYGIFLILTTNCATSSAQFPSL